MFAILATANGWAVAGDLTVATVPQLDAVLADATGPVVLDLGELRRLDDAGAECLRRWQSRGASVRRASPFVALLLQSPTPSLTSRSDKS
jgi:anti-anti-sigma regulatory factor